MLLLLLLLSGLLGTLDNRGRRGWTCGCLVESLMTRVIEDGANANIDRKPLPCPALVNAADRSDIAVITPVSDPYVPQAHGLAQGGIETRPALIRNHYFGPGVGSLPSDHFFLLRIRAVATARNKIARDVASRNSSHPDNPEQEMGKVLADPRADGEGILNGGENMRGALHVFELFVDQVRSGLRESFYGSITGLLRSFDERLKLLQVGYVSGRGHEVEIFFVDMRLVRIEFDEGLRLGGNVERIVSQHYRFRFDLQSAMFGKHIELMDPIAIGVPIGGAAGARGGGESKRQAALLFIVDRPQANLVVALGHGAVVEEFRGVNKPVAVHATTA